MRTNYGQSLMSTSANSRLRIRGMVALGASAALMGCPPTPSNPSGAVAPNVATIEYQPVGQCNGYPQTTDPSGRTVSAVSVGPHQAYAVYRVKNIKNNTSTLDLHFDPSRILVDVSPTARVDTSLAFYNDLGAFAAVGRTVPNGQIMGMNGFVVAVVHTDSVNGASDSNVQKATLRYELAPGEPGAIMAAVSSPSPWQMKDNCLELQLRLLGP
jgi:hypothetical protein